MGAGIHMRNSVPLWVVLLAAGLAVGAPLPPAAQIASAVLAAPADLRESAAVLGYNDLGKLVKLREGTGDLICLASDPGQTTFSVACYHKDLEPYMARGRELAAKKVAGQARNEIRWKEIGEGKLAMPREPRTLYVLTGSGYDPAAGKIADAHLRWVIYVPYATPESTGLSTKPGESAPWLMYPGTAGAHIMINPPKK
jgi:hypothetical protein